MVLSEQNIHKFPMLDVNVKSLQDDSFVSSDSTKIYQGFTIQRL